MTDKDIGDEIVDANHPDRSKNPDDETQPSCVIEEIDSGVSPESATSKADGQEADAAVPTKQSKGDRSFDAAGASSNVGLREWIMVGATVFAAMAAAAAAWVGFRQLEHWRAEEIDRATTRAAYVGQYKEQLLDVVEQAGMARQFPLARYRVASALQGLAEIDEITVIVGEEVVIDGGDLSCLDLKIIASSVGIYNVVSGDSGITIYAGDVRIASSTFDDTVITLLPQEELQVAFANAESNAIDPRVRANLSGVIFIDGSQIFSGEWLQELTVDGSYISDSALRFEGSKGKISTSAFERSSVSAHAPLSIRASGFMDMRSSEFQYFEDGSPCFVVKLDNGFNTRGKCPPARNPVLADGMNFGEFPYLAWFLRGYDLKTLGYQDQWAPAADAFGYQRLEIRELIGLGARKTPNTGRCRSIFEPDLPGLD